MKRGRIAKSHKTYTKELIKFNTTLVPIEKYITATTAIKHKCTECNTVAKLFPSNILHSCRKGRTGCDSCRLIKQNWATVIRKTPKQHITVLKNIKSPWRPLELYKGRQYKIKYKCRYCNSIKYINSGSVENGISCLCQRGSKYCSAIAIKFLNTIARKSGLTIKHAQNGGEYSPIMVSKTYKCDGYNPEHNIIFEFYGDAYHGNPRRYAPTDRCHPFDKSKTAKELFKMVVHKEYELQPNYNLITVWEYDWKNSRKKTIQEILQRIEAIIEIQTDWLNGFPNIKI